MSAAGFEPAIPAFDRPQTYALDRAATGSDINSLALELDIYSSAHYLCKMWIFYEPRRVTLGNTRHFVEE